MTTKAKPGHANAENAQTAHAQEAAQQAGSAAVVDSTRTESSLAPAKAVNQKQPTAPMPRDDHTGKGGVYHRQKDGSRVRMS